MPLSIFAKTIAGQCLLNICEFAPTTKPLLRNWGMRTKKEWFAGRVLRIQTPEGKSLRLASVGQNHLSFELFWKGTCYYEPVTTLVAQELLNPGDTFIDAGANIGFYSLVLSATRPGIRVIAFEPNPRNYSMLTRNVAASRLHGVHCEPIAFSDTDGTATLFLSASDMSASLRDDFESERTGSTVVETVRLDSYLSRGTAPRRLVIKVDVEGHEAAFFRGAADTIRKHTPDIITEVTLNYDRELLGFLETLGYRFYQITDRGLIEADEIGPVVRDRFVFLNYLLSRRTPDQAANLFRQIESKVSRIDLTRTSKYLSPAAVRKFVERSRVAATA